jgi:hypothetical protein
MRTTISHEFVDVIPDHLDEGILYICIPYTTAVHKCFCGCGHEVVTPLAPRQWSLICDGETISLTPSIGNWSFPCRSHYWIRAGEVHKARAFTATEIAALRADDRELLQHHYESRSTGKSKADQPTKRWWTRLATWLRQRFT